MKQQVHGQEEPPGVRTEAQDSSRVCLACAAALLFCVKLWGPSCRVTTLFPLPIGLGVRAEQDMIKLNIEMASLAKQGHWWLRLSPKSGTV